MKSTLQDIVICGAGYVGLSTAVAIKSASPHLNIIVVDGAPKDVWKNQNRAFALSTVAIRMLAQLNIWKKIEGDAQPIVDMIITDSKTSDPARPVFLTFEGSSKTNEPFAYMINSASLVGGLRTQAKKLDIPIIQSMTIDHFEIDENCVEIFNGGKKVLTTKLLVAADGAKSKLRDIAGIKTVSWNYGQSGIVTTVKHERPHNGRAVEHFLPAGPFAILPLKGNRSSLVWTESTKTAERLLAQDDFVFESELEQRFGHQLGALELDGERAAYPLGLTLARDYVKNRFALIGDAAHGIHPIAGQGLNLGMKDAAAFAQTIVEADRLGLDIEMLTILERYQSWRRFDAYQMGVVTDVLNRLFSNDITPIRLLRDFGLGLVQKMPPLKAYFIDQASGKPDKTAPKLLQGEPI